MLDQTICDTIVSAMDSDIFVAGRGGTLIYANPRARGRIGEDKIGRSLAEVFEDWGPEVRVHLTRVAQSNQWVPVNLPLKVRGCDDKIRFRARGVRDSKSGETMLLLVANSQRDKGFNRLRNLVRELNSELAERRRMQIALQSALDSEERLHTELIHRVKNNLALLTALIHFRQNSTDNEEVRGALHDLEMRVNAILAVHELLDRAGEIDYVQAGDLIRALCAQLKRSILPDHIEIENDLLDIYLSVEEATPLSLLVNELIINAVKHGFDDEQGGKVHVGLKKNGVDKLEVSIADDGKGFGDEEVKRGSGSKIVEALASQIGGTLERHDDGVGTHWSFIFPYNERDEKVPSLTGVGDPSMA